LARPIRQEFPQALVVALEGLAPLDGSPGSSAPGTPRQWFSVAGVTEDNRAERIAAALPALLQRVQAVQEASGVGPAATALWGFSQGAIMAMALVQAHDGLAGRVLAFAGRYAQLPSAAPQNTMLHLLHGAADPVIPARYAREAFQRLGELGGDATLDVADGVGHAIDGPLLQRAFFRLRNHIPARTWAQALGAVPAAGSNLLS
jgi:phospholipase/carboxylesterase